MTKIDFSVINDIWITQENLITVWVFGSSQNGCLKQNSDLDFGLFYSLQPTIDDLATLRAKLQLALAIEEIDLIVLNKANPILKFEAVSGRMLFCRDVENCSGFVSLCAREYEEAIAFLEYGMSAVSSKSY